MAQQFPDVRFPGWEVIRKLGEGSFGGVYEIHRTLPDGRVEKAALKKLTVPKDNSEIRELYSQSFSKENITAHYKDQMRELVNEYTLTQELNGCRNVVFCHDVQCVQHTDGIGWDIYIRMELLKPFKHVLSADYQEMAVLKLGLSLCNALLACQEHHIVHRDIKPQNIMLLDNGQLRMMDFGIARISRAENQIQNGKKAMGSVHYISPEQAKGEETDPKSDIYSVGVMMYEMLSGRLPFDADDMVEVARKQIRDTPKPLAELAPDVPLGLVQITERAMAKLPVNRYSSAAEMLGALDAYVQDPSVTFQYQYVKEEPEKVVNDPMPQKRSIRRPPEKPAANPARPKAKAKKKKRSAFMPVLLGITTAFALACAALCWTILNDSSNIMTKSDDIVLSDFSGMTQDEVNASEQVASGQVVVNWEEEYNNDYAAGYVYKQSPVAGRTVREGQSVTLTVSLGIHYVTVPDLTNYVQADGEQQLKDLGVSVLVTQAVDESVAAGSIIRTDPAAGSQVAAGTTVVIYVSRPQVATTTKVPSLIGMNVNDARTLLVQRKLGLGSQTEQYSDQPVGSIISQNPGEGASAKLNTRVSVVVSAGPEPAPEPEAPSESTASSDGSGGWLGGLFGGSSSSSESTSASSSSSTGGGLSDWWTSWLG